MDENEASVSIEGTVRDVVFYNEENDYAVLDVEADDGLLITVVGNIALPAEGERVKLSGHYTYHKEFGKQLVVEYYEKSLPATEDEILTYLSSQTVKGIGPKTARKIVDKFGTDSFFVIENHPEWLTDISGITSRKAAEMSASFREQNALLSLVSFVRGFMDVAEATRIYKRFGQGSVQRLKDNPYTLCEGLSGEEDVPDPIGMLTAAVERKTERGVVIGSEERTSVRDALRALTANVAWSCGAEREWGGIRAGMRADLIRLESGKIYENTWTITLNT